MLGAGAGVIQTGRDAMHVGRLAVFILQYIAETAVKHAGPAVTQRGGMFAGLGRFSACLDADEFHAFIADEWIKHARRVAAAADASHDRIGQTANLLQTLRPRFPADDRLKIAHDPRKRMRPDDRA